MNNGYIIQWKSKVNGRAGRGTKLFEKEEADRLAEELNREYPQIVHEVVPINPVPEQTPAGKVSDEPSAAEQPGPGAAPLFSTAVAI